MFSKKLKCPCGFEGDPKDFIDVKLLCDLCDYHDAYECPKCETQYDVILECWDSKLRSSEGKAKID